MALSNSPKSSPVYFIENVTLITWACWVWPRLLWRRIRQRSGSTTQCLTFDGSRLALFVARAMALPIGATVESLTFRQIDMRDEVGRMVRLRITHQDLAEVQELAMQEPGFKALTEGESVPDPQAVFLGKSIVNGTMTLRGTMRRALLLIQVCRWKMAQTEAPGDTPVLFLESRAWFRAISHYALNQGVSVIATPPPIFIRATILRNLPSWILDWLRTLRYQARRWRRSPIRSQPRADSKAITHGPLESSVEANIQKVFYTEKESGPRILVDYYGQFNLGRPDMYSDLFFWQMSPIAEKDLLLAFSLAKDPLDERKLSEMTAHGIKPIVLHPDATTIPDLPVFKSRHRPKPGQNHRLRATGHHKETKWLNAKLSDYESTRAYWSEVFSRNSVKVFVTAYKYDGTHCAIADAIQGLGGVAAVYQRSYETHPLADGATYADISFGFAPSSAVVERGSNSIIRYHVATGYLGDHRFSLLEDSVKTVRDKLRSNGAKRILAFFDENSADDTRWHTGHAFMQQNYAFLLEKVLTEPWLGLVFKPKTPGTLRRRLGPVAEMLKQAEATGRCHVFEAGAIQGSHCPAEAALTADIAIHGHVCAATAGVEAALAGVPTLLLDREGWPVSPLYRLGVGKVVFTQWEQLWEACQQHWSRSQGVEGFGDWSTMLDELDPFRDGHGAERMGTYLLWLIEGFKSGLDRETVMAEAAERYCDIWGKDKITEVNTLPQQSHGHATLRFV